jgi:muconolactone delta-isomerase
MRFMVVARVAPGSDRALIARRMPLEREHTRRLIEEGRILDAFVAEDASAAFLLFAAATRDELDALLDEFPLRDVLGWEVVALSS